MSKKEKYIFYLSLAAIPIIIYFYFIKWRSISIHDDDLFIFKAYSNLNGIAEKISLSRSFGHFRPVNDLTLYLIIECFKKNLADYYLFNVAIQTINTYLFALVINLFLKSSLRSLFFSLIFGLSRYCYYNITQFYNGGPLEGLATCFFLLSLFFILKVLIKNDLAPSQKQKGILLSLLFANLSLYTHERYVVLPAFIFLILLFFPAIKKMTVKQRISLSLLALASIILPFAIKKYIFATPVLLGTGGTNISFSISSAISYFIESVLDIMQISTGPGYLAGIPFSSLPLPDRVLIVLVISIIVGIFAVYGRNVWKAVFTKKEPDLSNFFVFLFLAVLFVLLLIPAIATIRLELRWLQAPLCIFIEMIIIALSSFHFKNNLIKNSVCSVFILLFLWTDYNYLNKGAENLYYSLSAKIGGVFKQAIDNGTIHPDASNLYILEKQKNADRENEITWALVYGYFFNYYQNKSKTMIFTDSVYHKSDSTPVSSFASFNKNTDQIIFLNIQNERFTFKYTISDITDLYIKDSLKSFQY